MWAINAKFGKKQSDCSQLIHSLTLEEASEESSDEEEEAEVECVDLEPVANIDELFDDFKGQLLSMSVFFYI